MDYTACFIQSESESLKLRFKYLVRIWVVQSKSTEYTIDHLLRMHACQ